MPRSRVRWIDKGDTHDLADPPVNGTCGPEAEAVTRGLGVSCLDDVSSIAGFNNPFGHYSWTMPLLELLVIAGAVAALVHAVRRLRREGDPTNLVLWFASLVYLAVTEPPLYFPEWFGLDKVYGFIFAHNEFSVQLMFDRLPLYIVAFYPAISALAYEVVRTTGIFRRRGPLVGAVAVAFVAQVFYEIFDHLGPQLKWWAWNPDNEQVSHPMLASVPMTSMLLFASVSIGFLTYLVVRLVGVDGTEPTSRPGRSLTGWALTGRTLLAGVLTPLGMLVAGVPSSIFGGNSPNVTAQAWVLGLELALVWAAGLWIFAREWRSPASADQVPLTGFVTVFPLAYLGVFAVFWASALPEYFAATDGVTAAGTPIGSGLYTLACFVGAGVALAALHRGRQGSNTATPELARTGQPA
ncbi:MAG: hypothetical protein WB471_14660 [Nocardioides sp.]